MASNVHLCKGTDVSNSDNLHSETPEEVNDLERFVPQEEDENKGCNNRTKQLLQDEYLIWTKKRYLLHSQIQM